MRIFPSGRATLAMVGTVLFCAIVSVALPSNPFHRWHLLEGTIHSNLGWIYERIHYDSTPIDIALVGPSRTGAGINAVQLGQELGLNVVNFSLPMAGRDSNYAIVKELLKYKSPKVIIIGVTENPSRYGHAAFKYFAENEDIIYPRYLVNLNYLENLIYLPYRQIKLFFAKFAPEIVGMPIEFDPMRYKGSVIDTTGDIILPNGQIRDGRTPASRADLEIAVGRYNQKVRPPLLPRSLRDIEFGDERTYVKKIASLADSKDVKVLFLMIPYYSSKNSTQEQDFYSKFGPILNANFIAGQPGLYMDYGHLTQAGAQQLTHSLRMPILAVLRNESTVGWGEAGAAE